MKKILYCLLLPCFFLLGNTSFAHSSNEAMDGGVEAYIVGKTGEVSYSFQIPDIYVSKEGDLLFPLEISLIANNGTPVYLMTSNNLNIDLTSYLTGVHLVKIEIKDIVFIYKVNL